MPSLPRFALPLPTFSLLSTPLHGRLLILMLLPPPPRHATLPITLLLHVYDAIAIGAATPSAALIHTCLLLICGAMI